MLLNRDNLIETAPVNLQKELGKDLNKESLKADQWAKLIKARVDEYDCVRKGWLLVDFPETREQSLALLACGVIPKHSSIIPKKFLTHPD